MPHKPMLTVSLLFLMLSSCSKVENKDFSDLPIIEAYLMPGSYPQVNISRQTPFSSSAEYATDDITKLQIFLGCNGTERELSSSGDGVYIDSSELCVTGASYTLRFVYNSLTVSAVTTTPSKPLNFTQSVTEISMERQDSTSGPPGTTMPDPVTVSWDNTDGSYYIVVIDCMEETLDPIRDFGDKEPPGNRFREAPTTSTAMEIRPNEFQYFGKHRLILYHVLPDYASLYDVNSTSSQNLTNPSTSIINGYGIFTGMNADTLYLNIRESSK
ncbi:MAG: DUF4249 family protein [Bacteroidota bacterium]